MNDAENKNVEGTIDDNCQVWKVKVFKDTIERLQHHVKEDEHSGGSIKSVKSVQKCQSKDGNHAIPEIVVDLSCFSIRFLENTRNWPKFLKKVERRGYNLKPNLELKNTVCDP